MDAIWIDFSKGVGAPGGAAIAGSAEFIDTARRFKYMYGGALRQSGILAAAALYGLEHNVPRMADDHSNARRLADGLAEAGIDVAQPESNMVFAAPAGGTQSFIEAMSAEGVRVGAVAERIRMVTHIGVSAADVERVIDAARRVVSA